MKISSLLAAGALVLLADGFALVHAARNRAGEPESEMILTQRELRTTYSVKDNSAVEFRLTWQNPDTQFNRTAGWLNRGKLAELGFDCSVDPAGAKSDVFYRRQRSRMGFVALEMDGPAWKEWLESQLRLTFDSDRASHLVMIDAASSVAELRRRHPDRHSVMILPSVVRIGWVPAITGAADRAAVPPRVVGYVELPASIHVPRPFADTVSPARIFSAGNYRVRVRVGGLTDMWVAGVDQVP